MIIDKVKMVITESSSCDIHEKDVNHALAEINKMPTSEIIDIQFEFIARPSTQCVTKIWYTIADDIIPN